MKCLYCGKRILAFRLFSGGETFCSEEHGDLYRKNEADSAIARILTLDAPKKPLRREPAAVPQPEPQPVAETVPQEAGFRLPVLTAQDSVVASGVAGPLATALACAAVPLRLELATGLEDSSYQLIGWPTGRTATSVPVEPISAARDWSRSPATPSPAPAMAVFSPPFVLRWKPCAVHARSRPQEVLTPRIAEKPLAFDAPGLASFSGRLPQSSARLSWSAMADGAATVRRADPALDAAPSVAMPYLQPERFQSSWSAHRLLPVWTKASAINGGYVSASAEVISALPRALRFPAANDARDGRPAPVAASLSWRPRGDSGQSTLDVQPAGTFTPAAPATLAARALTLTVPTPSPLGLVSCRPWPALVRVAAEPAVELAQWTAWPELPVASTRLTNSAAAVPAGWSALPGGSLRRATAPGLRLIDAPERCQASGLAAGPRPCAESKLAAGAAGTLPLMEAAPSPHVPASAALILPADEVRPPAQVTPRLTQPIPPVPLGAIAPAAQAPPPPASPRQTSLSREEVGLRLVSQWPEAGASVPRPLAPASLSQAFTLSTHQPQAVPSPPAGCLAIHDGTLRQPLAANGLPRLAATCTAAPVWGHTSDSRALDRVLAQRREAPLRLSMEEIPCSLTLDVLPAMPRPVPSPWTLLDLHVSRGTRDFIAAVPSQVERALRSPGSVAAEPMARVSGLPSTPFAITGWTPRVAAPEPVNRRRQLPASRPKMNLPHTRVPSQPLALPLVVAVEESLPEPTLVPYPAYAPVAD